MKEIVVISGKGGTGKTSITAAFASLAQNALLADCDVDAADLHLITSPEVIEPHPFISGNYAVIDNNLCKNCGLCQEYCRFDAIVKAENSYSSEETSCEGCGVCVKFCPHGAISFPERNCGDWYISKTRFGIMVHARLAIGAENSGKLVSLVRKEAREIAERNKSDLLIVDGPPGTGCPVISSITGADQVVIVTEPTLSGLHDLQRIIDLTAHFKILSALVINKWDINPEQSDKIETFAKDHECRFLGKVSYTREVTEAQIAGKNVIETGGEKIINEIKAIWNNIN